MYWVLNALIAAPYLWLGGGIVLVVLRDQVDVFPLRRKDALGFGWFILACGIGHLAVAAWGEHSTPTLLAHTQTVLASWLTCIGVTTMWFKVHRAGERFSIFTLLAPLLDRVRGGVAIIDEQWRYRYANPYLADVVNGGSLTAQEHLMRTIEEIYPDLWPQAREYLEEAERRGEVQFRFSAQMPGAGEIPFRGWYVNLPGFGRRPWKGAWVELDLEAMHERALEQAGGG